MAKSRLSAGGRNRSMVWGLRAYLSAGSARCANGGVVLAAAVDQAEDAEVELDYVERLYTEHDMWNSAFG